MTPPAAMHPDPVSAEAAMLVRALVLYALAEAQAGHATRIDVMADGDRFAVADDGRGHSIDKHIDETPYLSFIYEHFNFPFDRAAPGPVQLQGVGMSLINRLSSELRVKVRRANWQLDLAFEAGRLASSARAATRWPGSGTEVGGKADRATQATPETSNALVAWLGQIATCTPGLRISYNGQAVSGPA